MSVEQIFQSLSHDQRIQVLDLTLPGIERFLKDVLAKENLSKEVEILRCRYVNLLDGSMRQVTDECIDITNVSPLKTPQTNELVFSFEDTQSTKDDETSPKPATRPRNSRKRTNSTEESGVFFGTLSSQNTIYSESQENHRHSDTFESTSSKDTFMSDSEMEFLEWESDINFIEDGYSTGDNVELVSPNINLQPNEFGELHAGVLYIREPPGWHKRWFVVTETCLKCYKYKSDDKMLFEIPLRDAQFVSTDRNRNRMYPLTLSIARIKDNITFATIEEKSRQEWIYVINHVIQTFSHEHPKDGKTNNLVHPSDEFSNQQNSDKPQDENDPVAKRTTWHGESDQSVNAVLNPMKTGLNEESADLETSLPPTLAQEESFRELHQCLPDILLKQPSKSSDLPMVDNAQQHNLIRQDNLLKPDADNCDSATLPRVKRHGSLANSLTNKAARVRSKLTTSFFKKGKKDEKPRQDSGPQTTTFSGYLMRKKVNVWKSRWCVVRDKCFYCYKEFGAMLPELELTLPGCSVVSVLESDTEKAFVFLLAAQKERFLFAAENDAELEEWLEVLEKEVSVAEKDEDDTNGDINSASRGIKVKFCYCSRLSCKPPWYLEFRRRLSLSRYFTSAKA